MSTFRNRCDGLLAFWPGPFCLALVILVLDQASKLLVLHHWPLHHQVSVIPGFFSLVHYRNPGAAWGMFANHTEVLAILSAVVMMGLVLWFRRLVEGFPERAMALGAVLGGIGGNLIDRVAYGEVVDFLLFYWRSFQWPAFNIADSAISCGVTVFVVSSFLRHQPGDAPAADADASDRPEPPGSAPVPP